MKNNFFLKLKKYFFLHWSSDYGKFRFRFSVWFWTEISAETKRLNNTKTETEMHSETEISAETDTETENFRSLITVFVSLLLKFIDSIFLFSFKFLINGSMHKIKREQLKASPCFTPLSILIFSLKYFCTFGLFVGCGTLETLSKALILLKSLKNVS